MFINIMNQSTVFVDGIQVIVEYESLFNGITELVETYVKDHLSHLRLDTDKYVLPNLMSGIDNISMHIPFQELHTEWETVVRARYSRSSVRVKIPIHVRYQGLNDELLRKHVKKLAEKACSKRRTDVTGRLFYRDKPYTKADFTILSVDGLIDDDTLDQLINLERSDLMLRACIVTPFLMMLFGLLPLAKTSAVHAHYYYANTFDATPEYANVIQILTYVGCLLLSIGIQLAITLWLGCDNYLTYAWFVLLGCVGGLANLIVMSIAC